MNNINSYITELIENSERPKSVSNANSHIFYQFLEAASVRLSFDEKLNLIWAFTTVEKGLKEARRGNKEYSKFYFDELPSYLANCDFLPEATDFFTLPGRAFYHYDIEKDLPTALQLLQKSLVSIGKISNAGFPFMQLAGIEQYLNVCRILYRKDRELSFAEFGKLISYMITGHFDLQYTDVQFLSHADLLEQKDRVSMLNYVTDAVLFKYKELWTEENKLLHLENIYNDLLQSRDVELSGFFNGYFSIVQYIIDSMKSGQKSLHYQGDIIREYFKDTSRVLQFLFLNQIEQNYSTELESATVEKIKQYCIDVLHLGHFYSDPKQTSAPISSPLRVTSEGALVTV